MRETVPWYAGLLVAVLATAPAALPSRSRGQVVDTIPPPIVQNVAFEQKLGAQIPLDLPVRDEAGQEVKLRDFFGEQPVVLSLVYYECPMLCTLVLNGLVDSLRELPFTAGREMQVLTVSFDPGETPELAAAKKATYLHQYARAGAGSGWHFLTGSEESIRRLTDAVGFRYQYDEKSDQYAHASGLLVVTPEGKVSHYLFGVEYPPRDLRLSLVEASEHRIGSAVDRLLLFCYHYNPITGKYSAAVMNFIRLGCVVTVLALAGFMFAMRRREVAARRQAGTAGAGPGP
jgi:protein SCO1/2